MPALMAKDAIIMVFDGKPQSEPEQSGRRYNDYTVRYNNSAYNGIAGINET